MSKIKIMDEILANKIAAGEVVERCSSVVKELTENAIDAKSKSIKIALIDSGTKEIKVTDDGIGMDEQDATLAFQRHATSKLLDEDDLYRISTLGFRGEALPSIASVSKVTLTTSTGNGGCEVIIEGGHIVSVSKAPERKGTIVSVKDLFYNTPARLKHMKSLYTELASITDYVNKLALSHPDIRFHLSNNNHTILSTDGSGNLLKTISFVYGMELSKKMISISGENDDYQVEGYISLPEIHRSNRNAMVFIVNGRVVRNIELNRTIKEAYHSYQPDNRYPVVVLNITVDTSLVDVNIHPTKMDIKFGKIEDLEQLLMNIITDQLKKINLIPHMEEETLWSMPKPTYENLQMSLSRIEEPKEEPIKLAPQEEIKEEEFKEITKTVEEKKQEKRLPELYPVGSVHGTYLVCQNETGMYLIDQHAAKERINYEICLNKLGNPKKESISLLFPLIIEFPTNEMMILKKNIDLLKNMNFDVEEFGIQSLIVKAHPTWIPKGNEERAIRKVLELLISEEKNFDLKRFHDHVAATMACKMSIKANDQITLPEMENLINDLRKCQNPFHCPHGRPTMVYFSTKELEKLFKRSGF